jgi:hypothetical protein
MRHRKVLDLNPVRCEGCNREVHSQQRHVLCMRCKPTQMGSLKEQRENKQHQSKQEEVE